MQVAFEEKEWELDQLEKLKEEQEAEIDEDNEPLFYESMCRAVVLAVWCCVNGRGGVVGCGRVVGGRRSERSRVSMGAFLFVGGPLRMVGEQRDGRGVRLRWQLWA